MEHLTGDQSQPTQPVQKTLPKIVKTWLYRDENGKGVKKINRWEPGFSGTSKSMTPEVFHNGKWFTRANFKNREAEWEPLWSNVAGLPLNLPEIIKRKNEAVYIVEGETCFDQLNDWGFLATTGSGGVNTKTDWSNYWQNRTVIILPDNDETGYKYALKTAQSLQEKAKKIRVVFLPDLEEKGDIVDWVKKGGTKKQFLDIVSNTTAWDGKQFTYQNKPDAKPKQRIKVQKMNEIEEKEVNWLFQNFIPLHMTTVLVGDPGDGKNFLTMWLSSVVSSTGHFFRGQAVLNGDVLICNSEDDYSRTIKLLNIKPKKEYFSGRWMWSFFQDIQDNSSTKNNLATFEDCQVISGNSENLAILGKTEQILPVSTVATHCDNTPNNVMKTHSLSTVGKHCGPPKKNPPNLTKQ